LHPRLFIFRIAGFILGFSELNYAVTEDAGSVEVCVDLLMGNPNEISISIETIPDTAGNYCSYSGTPVD